MTNDHISGIGIYNKNLFLELEKQLGAEVSPVLKWNRFSKKAIAQKHIQKPIHFLPPFILDKKILYHGTDHKLNTKSLGPTVVTIHDMQPFVGKWLDPLFAQRRRAVIDKTLRSSVDRIIAVSDFTKNEILNYYPRLESRIDVVYHGYSFPTLNSTEANRLPELIGGRPFLLFIGNIEERKNLINQILAFELLKKECPDLMFVVAGKPGFNYASILASVQNSAFKESILLVGYLNESEKYFALVHTSCLMFASWYEGFGIPAIEALAYNSNVLISETGALQEIAGEYCHSANPAQVDDLAHKTLMIMNQGNKKPIELDGWKTKWSWQETANGTIAVYQKAYM